MRFPPGGIAVSFDSLIINQTTRPVLATSTVISGPGISNANAKKWA
jgi:hypothetical protein